MNCSQILPGAVNPGSCSLATGYCSANPFVVYASGKDVILLDGHLQHLQTIFGGTYGYSTKVSCVHCAEAVGRVAIGWGTDVVILDPSSVEELIGSNQGGQGGTNLNKEFLVEWNPVQTLSLDYPVTSICWNRNGTQLLTGGENIVLWEYETTPFNMETIVNDTDLEEKEGEEGKETGLKQEADGKGTLKEIWRCEVPSPIIHLKLSPDGELFATCGEDDCLVKIWYPCSSGSIGIGTPPTFSFCYVAHPQSVRGFVWRRVTPSLPRGCIPNVLLTHCTDNICRLWSHSVFFEKKGRLRFFIAASIDPVADIPFRTTMPLNNQPFIVHWLNNKETTLTSRVDKYQKGLSLPVSHFSSIQSFTSIFNEEILQSWVCIEDGDETDDAHTGMGGGAGKSDRELTDVVSSSSRKNVTSYSFSNYLSPRVGERPNSANNMSPNQIGSLKSKITVQQKRALAHLLDEWCYTPDLLLCIHPTVGSLMVWTVEGLDAPPNLERLVHVSFSSCLPHIFPPYLSQSLQQDLLQFLIKEPDILHTREANAEGGGGGGAADVSLPVPQIHLSGRNMSNMSNLEISEDVHKIKADTTLILISSHSNGSLNTWSVELTMQSNYCTSIAGLIHCAGTGGHRSKVKKIQRHPWLPILMSISSESALGKDEKDISGIEVAMSELIIWNADLPGPLQHKSKLNELSRISVPNMQSFNLVTWVPPIPIGGLNEGALGRFPSQGLFVANVGSELLLFQASLYSITKPQPSSFVQSDGDKAKVTDEETSLASDSHNVKVTSQLGTKGISLICVIESDLSRFDEVVGLHAFRMCSIVTSFDLKNSVDCKFCRDIVLVLLENRTPPDHTSHIASNSQRSPGAKGTKSFIHLWKLTVCADPAITSNSQDSPNHSQSIVYKASVTKVSSEPLPLPLGTFVIESTPACDISSSLQLQTPTLSTPFIFCTSCSDGTIRCWQCSLKSRDSRPTTQHSSSNSSSQRSPEGSSNVEFNIYEVFDSNARNSDMKMEPNLLDCYEEDVIKSLPTESFVPSGIKVAYPGRLAMAHKLSKPIKSSIHRDSSMSTWPSRTSIVKGNNPLDRYSMVTVWECESSGGLKWICEATLMLVGVAQVTTSKSERNNMQVLMEWIPMENGAYLLSTSFSSTISIFGMSLPQQDEEQFAVQMKSVGFHSKEKSTVLSKIKLQASWVCLLQFPCFRSSLDLSISYLAYTGSNSIVVSVGSGIHLYSCWVDGDVLVTFTPSEKERKKLSKGPLSRVFVHDATPSHSNYLAESKVVNLLDYAHARNTPLPQYHPKILTELLNSGKLHAVKAILVNLVKFLLLYDVKKSLTDDNEGTGNYFDDGGMEKYEDEVQEKKNHLILSPDGYLHRSKSAQPKGLIDTIPHLPLAKMGIVQLKGTFVTSEQLDTMDSPENAGDDYDQLFSMNNFDDPLKFGLEEEDEMEVSFTDLDPERSNFTPRLAQILMSILDSHQLVDLNDLEQIQLLSIADTVASTRMSISDQPPSYVTTSLDSSASTGFLLSTLSGAGYASSGRSKGKEAMDDCGLRYLLSLESYITLSKSLPSDISLSPLSPSALVWAFHSEAETELLSAIPCIQKDELKWEELRNAGVGWWLRSLDTLRRLMEKLAKAQFMRNRQPLDASLFYLAMKKQSLLKGLFKSVSDSKMTTFFSNNFSTDRWKKAAQKNAFALLGKQRFEEAAAFFLLADKLWDAVEVCVSRLKDLQLAFVIIRLYEGDHGPIYNQYLREYILGIQSQEKGQILDVSLDPFLRSMVYWLLQDYSAALETLLVEVDDASGDNDKLQVFFTNPAIFNFYFYLRTHPFLIRRDNKTANTSFLMAQPHSTSLLHKPLGKGSLGKGSLSNVGDEPLTPVERSLLFGTAYYHLCHGCPLLVLNVLSRLPKSSNLGSDVCDVNSGVSKGAGQSLPNHSPTPVYSMTGMIESGTLASSFGGTEGKNEGGDEDDDFDWGASVSSQTCRRYGKEEEEEEEEDWSKPVNNRYSEVDEIDWSKPVSSQFYSQNTPILSPPRFSSSSTPNGVDNSLPGEHPIPPLQTSSTLTTRGLFVLTLAEQLQYNACLSILTEELHHIYVPACCHFLWEMKGPRSLPFLPLPKQSLDSELSLAKHHSKNTFDKTVQNLRGMLMDWLRGETGTVKEVCRLESPDIKEDGCDSLNKGVLDNSIPSGYDLLTTLMNYSSLHAATSPSLLTVKFELMHLMNTLFPWSTGCHDNITQGKDLSITQDTSLEVVPTCAIDPSQLPILTSCSLPVRHLTNLASHLRLLSSCIIKILAKHTYPPISSQPLPQVQRIFELCCAISHCITVSLNPVLLSDITGTLLDAPAHKIGMTASVGSLGRTPTPSSVLVDSQHQQPQREVKSNQTPLLRQRMDSFSNLDSTIGTPNTKPSKWPGVSNWPHTLTSDEGRDPTPLSVVLVECVVSVYLGLLSTAWSQHSVEDLYILLKNNPSMDSWYEILGGGVDGKRSERILSKNFVTQTIESVSKRFGLKRPNPTLQEEEELGVFIAPKRTLLDCFFSMPSSEGKEPVRKNELSGSFLLVRKEERKEDTEEEDDDDDDDGITFKTSGVRSGTTINDGTETSPLNPDCFAWCLMNLCISKLMQKAVRKLVAGVGLEVLELVTVSPMLYLTLKIMDEWESIFTRRLDALGETPDDLFGSDESETSKFSIGLSLMRHKFILEPENSPFRSKDRLSRNCKKLWQFLVHQDEPRETIIQYIYANKNGTASSTGYLDDDESDGIPEPTCKVIHKDPDNTISAFCLNSCSGAQKTMLALALPREVMEIEVPDNSILDNVSNGSSENISKTSPKRSMSIVPQDFIMVQSTSKLQRPNFTTQIRRSMGSLPGLPIFPSSSSSTPQLTHRQTGSNASLLIKRPTFGVKRMAPHPSLAYYLTGSLDGSVIMWEFGTPQPVATQREPGMGGGVTKIRFTPEGNKYGVTDSNGKLSLWQGIHTTTKHAYHILHSSMKYLGDFLFLGSSSFIATCGDGIESRNLYLWDTLMPTNRSIVKEFTCHEGGATSLGYSLTKQRLFCGGKKGEVCIFDIRRSSLLHCISVHNSSINCIAVNDIDGYFVTGASDGDIKVIDSSTLTELAFFSGQHAKSRLFRHGEGGVTDLDIMPGGKLYSCGADGSIKCQTLKL